MPARAIRTLSFSLLAFAGAAACGGVVVVQGDTPGGGGADSPGSGRDTLAGGAGSTGVTSPASGVPSAGGHVATVGLGGATAAGGRDATAGGNGGHVSGSGGFFGTGGSAPGDSGASGALCASISEKPEAVVPDTLILLDRSQSLSCPAADGRDRWSAVRTALTDYLKGYGAGRNIGIQYFGLEQPADAGPSCNQADYRTPDVDVGPWDENAPLIIESLARQSPGGPRTTVPALIGAFDHLIEQGSHAGALAAVVLVTDGAPDACGSWADVAHAAAVGFENGITTFVIGLTASDDTCDGNMDPTTQKDLDAVAQAGGSTSATLIDVQSGVEMPLISAINEAVLMTPTPCRYRLPKLPQGAAFDPAKVDVVYTASGTMSRTQVPAVAASATCNAKEGGWYVDDGVDPKEIVLCPETCTAIDAQRGSLELDFGCATGQR